MEKKKNIYLKLFLSTFYLSAFTFGGGYVIITLMKKRFVDELNWIDESEMLDITAIAQSAPGIIAVNASILIGYKIAGLLGSFITVLGTILPPLIIISIISLFYNSFRENIVIKILMQGMQVGVGVVILDVVLNMIKNLKKDKKIEPFIILFISFVAAFIVKINVIYIILFSAVLGILNCFKKIESK